MCCDRFSLLKNLDVFIVMFVRLFNRLFSTKKLLCRWLIHFLYFSDCETQQNPALGNTNPKTTAVVRKKFILIVRVRCLMIMKILHWHFLIKRVQFWQNPQFLSHLVLISFKIISLSRTLISWTSRLLKPSFRSLYLVISTFSSNSQHCHLNWA